MIEPPLTNRGEILELSDGISRPGSISKKKAAITASCGLAEVTYAAARQLRSFKLC